MRRSNTAPRIENFQTPVTANENHRSVHGLNMNGINGTGFIGFKPGLADWDEPPELVVID